ncbi:MAG: protein kinase domain-containing protein [Pseudonocardia sp.]
MAKPARVIAGRYELTAPIGRGGMGEVWAAYDNRLDRRVALKLLRPDIVPAGTAGRSVVARFKREARLTARLEHPGVPAVFDVGAECDELYLAMQLVDGQDLGDVLSTRGTLPVEWVVAIGAQIAAVLAAAHEVSLVHRDLKPRNVMLSRGGTVKVLDFGVAALLDPEITRVTATGEAVGSPAYMSPEQITSATVSPRSDLYALGCVLHELFTGEEVFDATMPMAQMYAHLERDPQPLRALRADVPEIVERLVLDLLAKDPEARPNGAEEVYRRLRPLLPTPSDSPADSSDALDPGRPYRRPLAPPPRTPRVAAAAAAPTLPLADIREQAAELAEAGRFTQAAELLTRRIRNALEPAADLRGARFQLAHTLLLGGEFGRALPEFQTVAAELAALRGASDEDVLQCRVQIATCHAELGQISTAIEELKAVLQVRRAERGDANAEVLELRRQIGLLLATSGDLHGAERVLRELRSDMEHVLGSGHMAVGELHTVLQRVEAARRASGR